MAEFCTHTVLSSDGQTLHTVRLGDNPSCTCQGFKYRRHCKHIEGLLEGREEEEEPMSTTSQPTVSQPTATAPDVNAIAALLAEPFDRGEVKFKPQTVRGNQALAVAFIDARCVMDRLDEVVGPTNWTDQYDRLDDGGVVCTLRVRIGTEWVSHQDVGAYSDQPDEDDRRKSAFSDALKRAAVKFGIGRYLYRGKPQWVDYDPQKKRFLQEPKLPGDPPAKPATQPPVPAQEQVEPKIGKQPEAPSQSNHRETLAWVRKAEARLVERGACKTGHLIGSLLERLGAGWQHEPIDQVKAEAIAIGQWFLKNPVGAATDSDSEEGGEQW